MCNRLRFAGSWLAALLAAAATQSVLAAQPHADAESENGAGKTADVQSGLDGSEHSPMFCSILDLKTGRMPEEPPPLLPGQRAVDRAFPGGNLQHDLTHEEEYRQYARDTADFALQTLYSLGLFRAATGSGFCEAANGVGLLLIELLRLHLLETGSDYSLPRSYNNT